MRSPELVRRAPRHPISHRAGWLLGCVVTFVLLGLVWGAWKATHRPPPIPDPPNLARLDPLVRDHLVGLANRVAADPADAGCRVDLGLALAVNGFWVESRQCFLDAEQLGEPGPLPRLYASLALSELGDWAGAVAELQKTVRAYSGHAPSWHRLGRLYIDLGDSTAAEEAFTVVTRLEPHSWHGWTGLGDALLRSGRDLEAIAPLERAIALDPYARSARHLLGQAYRTAGRTAEAEREMAAGMASSLAPMPDGWSLRALDHMKSLPDQFERTDTLLARGQIDEATVQLRELLRYHPTNVAVLRRLAQALQSGDHPEAAWELLTGALPQHPHDVGLLMAVSSAAAQLGKFEKALAMAREAVNRAPRLAEVHVAKANALIAAGRDEEAVDSLMDAIDRAPRSAELQLQLGDVLRYNLGRPEEALVRYQEALDRDPIQPIGLHRLASLLLERGDHLAAQRRVDELRRLAIDPEGVAELEALLERAPRSP